MKTALLALSAAAFALIATPATAAGSAAPTASHSITQSVPVVGANHSVVENAELRGKRRGFARHKRFSKHHHKRTFRSKRFKHRDSRFVHHDKFHNTHHPHYKVDRKFHDRKFHDRRFRTKKFKHKSFHRFRH